MLGCVEFDDITLQYLRAVAAAESRNLIDKFRSLLLGDKTCRLYRVYQNAEFGNIETAVNNIIRIAVLSALTYNFISEVV